MQIIKNWIQINNEIERKEKLLEILKEEYFLFCQTLLNSNNNNAYNSPNKYRTIIFANTLAISNDVYNYINNNITNIKSLSLELLLTQKPIVRCFIINRHVKFEDRLTIINSFNNDQRGITPTTTQAVNDDMTSDTAATDTRTRVDIAVPASSSESSIGLDVLVCTNVVSRGIDFVDVRHVIEYNVAYDVTEHMHRCGRTNRLGARRRTDGNQQENESIGRVTSLYGAEDELLVEKIRSRDHIADAFSRKRSLRRSHKRSQQKSLDSEDKLLPSHVDVDDNKDDDASHVALTHSDGVEQKM